MRSSIAFVPLIAVLGACVEKSPPAEPAAATAAKLVRSYVVGSADAAEDRRYSGEVRARHETLLGFRIGGKMTERLVDVGARVRLGQPLARLDPADSRLAASQAEANRALAAAELKRGRELKAKEFISQAALDAREAAAKTAEAQAQLAANQTGYTVLGADAPGVVAAVLAEPGQVLAAGQGVFRLARDGEREVAIAVPETAMATLRAGGEASVTLWADGATYPGRVREIAPVADPATRTFPVRVSIVGADPTLALGMTAAVRFPRAGAEKIVVPQAAIFQQGEQPAVWVIGGGNTISLRPVAVERYSDAGAVVKSGLAPGERIVAAGAFKLTAGEKVRLAEK